MRKVTRVLAAVAALSFAASAQATIVIIPTDVGLGGVPVTFVNQGPSATVTGSFDGGTNNFAVSGTTYGGEDQLITLNNLILSDSTGISSLDFFVPGAGLFNNFGVFVFGDGTMTVTVTDNAGEITSQPFFVSGTGGFFSILGFDGESIRTVNVTPNSGSVFYVTDLSASAVAAETSAVPELAPWAMMLMGFGATGIALRRRRKTAMAQVA